MHYSVTNSLRITGWKKERTFREGNAYIAASNRRKGIRMKTRLAFRDERGKSTDSDGHGMA